MAYSKEISSAEIIKRIGTKWSISEERGLWLIEDDDLVVFSPGMSTAGFAEIRMAQANPRRKVIATTIDESGLEFAQEVIGGVNLHGQIETLLEDLREENRYPDNSFDFIYARLVLHYLSAQDLDKVLCDFYRTLRPNGTLFIVVRSVKNIPEREDITFDQETQLTTIPHYDNQGEVTSLETRYFHTPESIAEHLGNAGLNIRQIAEYREQLYKDFMRKELSPIFDHVIEVLGEKSIQP